MEQFKIVQDKLNDLVVDIARLCDNYYKLMDENKETMAQMELLADNSKVTLESAGKELDEFSRLSEAYVNVHREYWKKSLYISTVETCPIKAFENYLCETKQLDANIARDKEQLASMRADLQNDSRRYDAYVELQRKWLEIAVPLFHKAMIMGIRIELNANGFSFLSANNSNPAGFYPKTTTIKSRGFKHIMLMLFHLPEYLHLTKLCKKAVQAWAAHIDLKSGQGVDISTNLRLKMKRLAKNIGTTEVTLRQNTEKAKDLHQKIVELKPYYDLIKDGEDAFCEIPLSNFNTSFDYKSAIIGFYERILLDLPLTDEQKAYYLDVCKKYPDFKDAEKYLNAEFSKKKDVLSAKGKKLTDESKSMSNEIYGKVEEGKKIIAGVDELTVKCNSLINEAIDIDPIRFFSCGRGEHLMDNTEAIVDKVLGIATDRVTLESVPSLIKMLNNRAPFPMLVGFQEREHTNPTNYIVTPEHSYDNIENALNNLLVTLLASFPAGKAKFTFVDMQMQGGAGEIFRRLPNSISNVILSDNDLRKKIASLKDMVSRVSVHTNNIVEFNEKAGSITHPYEFVIWRNYTGAERDLLHEADIMPLIKNGYRYGIYFILLPSEEIDISNTVLSNYVNELIISDKEYQDFAGRFVNSLVNRIVENSKNKKADSVRWNGLAKALQTPPVEIPENGMIIPVGEYPDGEVACYEFNDRFHHSLIIGTSGSGKSYLLHNILLNSMLKYDARYLEFYLMDFKFGGGEFKSYEGMPHVSHLLSDGLDKSIVLEVMRELERKMIERGKMIEQYKKLSVYNAHHPENPLPHIVLVVDEASLLFQIANNKETKLQNEINRILGYIATQGRSQGVTFCFATQTFAGADIPTNILRNITNRFLLKCESADADRLIERNGASISESLTQGYTYMSASQKIARIFDYNYVDGGVNMLRKYQDAICHFNSRPAGRNNFVYDGKASREYSAADIESIKTKKVPTLLLGSGVTVKQEPISVSFRKDMGENLLITGTNGEMQSERVFYNAVMSACEWAAASGKRVNVVCFDNYNDGDDNNVRYEQLNSIGNASFTSVVNGRSRDEMIVELGSKIRNNTVGDQIYILALLGHERYRRNMGNPLTDIASSQATAAAATNRGASRYMPEENSSRPGMINIGGLAPAPVSSVKSTSSNIEEELMYILNFGPESGVHTIMHVDRPSSIVPVSERWSRREIQRAFKYISVLNLNSTEISKLPVMEDVSVESLSADNERLRAVFYDDENNKAVLFTPFDFKNNFRIQ